MSISWLQGLLYGVVSGLSELLPISSQAHQILLRQFFGMTNQEPILDIIVHISVLLSLLFSMNSFLGQVQREKRLHRSRYSNSKPYMNMQLSKNAAVPMVIGMVVLLYIKKSVGTLPILTLFMFINGLLLYIADRIVRGNKDVRSMTMLDSYFIGILGVLGALPGLSRIASTSVAALFRGADRHNAIHWSLLLSIPAIFLLIFYDFIGIFSVTEAIPVMSNFLSYLTAAVGAFFGGYISIKLLKTICVHSGFSIFAFYSWGFSLLLLFIYLTVV